MGLLVLNQIVESYLNCWKVARSIWLVNPSLTIEEMASHPQILICLEEYPADLQRKIIADLYPQETPGFEFEYYFSLPALLLEEAIALWMDVNPLIVALAKSNPGYWERWYAPFLWVDIRTKLEQAKRSAVLGDLKSQSDSGQIYVRQADFFKWAQLQWGAPDGGRTRDICARYSITDTPEIESAKPSKVDLKKEAITKILDRLEAIDPDFNRMAMVGRKVDFLELCKQLDTDKSMFYVSPSTFEEYLPGLCAFKPGSRKTDYYEQALLKLG